MVPTAVSLGFGVLFETAITLAPTAYIILDDIGRAMRRAFGGPQAGGGNGTLSAGPARWRYLTRTCALKWTPTLGGSIAHRQAA